jgi:DNA-binding MarR family transcriptional regulator
MLELKFAMERWLNHSVNRTMSEFMRYIHAHNLTLVQMNLLMHIYYQGPCELTRLTAPLQIGKSAVSQMVERLVQLGYLQRGEDPADRRTRRVELTPRARILVEEGVAARSRWIEQTCAGMSAEEHSTVQSALNALNDWMER